MPKIHPTEESIVRKMIKNSLKIIGKLDDGINEFTARIISMKTARLESGVTDPEEKILRYMRASLYRDRLGSLESLDNRLAWLYTPEQVEEYRVRKLKKAFNKSKKRIREVGKKIENITDDRQLSIYKDWMAKHQADIDYIESLDLPE